MKTYSLFVVCTLAILMALAVTGRSQTQNGSAVMWEPVNIKQRNLYTGPGGTALRPNLRRLTFVEKEKGGNNLKYRIKDASGRVWVAKIADES